MSSTGFTTASENVVFKVKIKLSTSWKKEKQLNKNAET